MAGLTKRYKQSLMYITVAQIRDFIKGGQANSALSYGFVFIEGKMKPLEWFEGFKDTDLFRIKCFSSISTMHLHKD